MKFSPVRKAYPLKSFEGGLFHGIKCVVDRVFFLAKRALAVTDRKSQAALCVGAVHQRPRKGALDFAVHEIAHSQTLVAFRTNPVAPFHIVAAGTNEFHSSVRLLLIAFKFHLPNRGRVRDETCEWEFKLFGRIPRQCAREYGAVLDLEVPAQDFLLGSYIAPQFPLREAHFSVSKRRKFQL